MGSLFTVREVWETPPSPQSEHDGLSLCVANIDNDPSGQGGCQGAGGVRTCACAAGSVR